MTLKVKAAVGSVIPNAPGSTYHGQPISEEFSRVMVDQIMDGFEDLELDHPTSEGEIRLGSTTRKRAIDDMTTNGAPDMWCAITIY